MANSSLDQLNKTQKILKWLFFALAIGFSAFLIMNGAIKGETSASESNAVAHFLANIVNFFAPGTITQETFPQFASFTRKLIGHFLAFTVNSVFVSLATYYFLIDKKWYRFYLIFLISFVAGLIVAFLSEFLQLFAGGRTASFVDVLIDMGGFVLGLGIIFLILFFNKKHKQKVQK